MRVPKGGVAFFDSGIGGLTVLSACEKYFSEGTFYYYGDNMRAPYGNLPPKTIKKYVLKAFKNFRRLRVSAAVIACNTATAVCVEELRRRFSFPIIGAEPAVFTAARAGGEILALCTRATFESERFKNLCKEASKLYPQAKLRAVACDGLAGEIERNISVKGYDYTPFLPQGKPDAVVLGCTHYIYIKKEIENFYGCKVYDGNEGIAKRLLFSLRESEKNMKKGKLRPGKGKKGDGRPYGGIFDHDLGKSTTDTHFENVKKAENLKINKRSRFRSKNCKKNAEKKKIFFLGKCKKNNEKLYKQTFV